MTLIGYDQRKVIHPDDGPPAEHCSRCDEPALPSDTDDDGRCERCAEEFAHDEDDASRETAHDVAMDYKMSRSGR